MRRSEKDRNIPERTWANTLEKAIDLARQSDNVKAFGAFIVYKKRSFNFRAVRPDMVDKIISDNIFDVLHSEVL